ncbi:SusC/RagA family TonB-linked outer membrane protein [Dyadobacter subterraneus]|uniref:SusC/RagA family TonB-linked outer membrane protein n=1 Tax=Dyadobacter subterraneus TaxID=2773304 RepID=A0ABR9W9K9_9BACT|nr:SusC/RagA family TonB-linked outer membrane protein [Dyadobacter subterraneus]MBE9462122.1 SusC/RagA family TonB-linked outer membrane protein [Dyadobacter subterraneus]
MRLFLTLFFLGLLQTLSAQSVLKGRVVSLPDSAALAGAVIKLKGVNQGVTTDENGRFTLVTELDTLSLQISYIGFQPRELRLHLPAPNLVVAGLLPDENQLGEVVISTGYEKIPRERATGSFSFVDNALLNRRVGADIVSRLDDVAAGLINNRGKGGAQGLLIRGQSTINSAARPLIVIDNFAYAGDLNTINPNDIESITILKDAAAASIWGSRAGNGVIVITTKKGSGSGAVQISLNSNLTVGAKPDLFYQPRMSTADYIANERHLFESGGYSSAEKSASHYPLTPVSELLIAQRDKVISAEQAESQIQKLTSYDVRNDYEKYLYQSSISQQYALSFKGGSPKHRYFVSGGYDRTRPSEVGNSSQRLTFNANNTFVLSPKLEFSAGIYYAESKSKTNNPGALTYTNPLTGNISTAIYPYAQLADQNGNALSIIKDYRLSFTGQAQKQGLLNWDYSPLQEMAAADNSVKLTDYRINLGTEYKILPSLTFSGLYQYGRGITVSRNLYSQNTYMARNLINQLTSVDSAGLVRRNLPLGGILDQSESAYTSHSGRAQLHYQQTLFGTDELTVLAGAEIRNFSTEGGSSRYYGYDERYASNSPVDYTTAFRSFVNPATTLRIPFVDSRYGTTDRYLSFYVNGSYTLKKKYIFSASARKDQSNLFGVKTNDKSVPLYSLGAAWNLSQERFFHVGWLPYLKLRSTFGYSGNSNTNVSAYTTAYIEGTDYYTGAPYAVISNPPNSNLRWEKVKNLNFALDFETRNRILSGTVEYYLKKGIDLIGSMPYPGSSGVKTFTGNYASTSGRGLDVTLSARIFDKVFKWQSDLLFSRAADKVTKYDVKALSTDYLGNGDGTSIYPLEGKPLYSVYSLKWAGLDPLTGNPQGYLGSEVSKDYASILKADPATLVYNGPARPKLFGALRNSFSWKSLALSVNINYRFGHYFRLRSVSYTDLNNGVVTHSDYALRWQKPGDELTTQVPSSPQISNTNRDNFYAYAQPLVKKADNIRLQDINLSYNLTGGGLKKLPFHSASLYLYANNIGILWKSYKGKLDPDYAQAAFAPVRSLSLGVKIDL